MALATRRRANLRTLGIIVLLAGLAAGAFTYWRAGADDATTDDEVLFEQEQSKAYQRELERNVGPFGALVARWEANIGELGQPRPLAVTIMVVSCAVAGGCFWAAARQTD